MIIEEVEENARSAVRKQNADSSLEEKFALLARFLILKKQFAPTRKKNGRDLEIGSDEYLDSLARSFLTARADRAPAVPRTVPDKMIAFILKHHYNVEIEKLEEIISAHQSSMAAENYVGYLLERFLSSVLEPLGWVWCSGSSVTAVDFIKPPAHASLPWQMLQVKNRDNSENSSSSKVRLGTEIKKWHRTFSATGATNWLAFPEGDARDELTEEKFEIFVADYLSRIKRGA
ncbi:MAG: SinI family restriction endonuclease [Candidatus Eremiobacteraeota bacterium]|nr:SinI family restriction endonuclease [Candidatus Eremiobacteraeota bacterium]NNM92343.1 SinI family restriction endonuclease [Candidatus Eremiobacteraeota bacterium]